MFDSYEVTVDDTSQTGTSVAATSPFQSTKKLLNTGVSGTETGAAFARSVTHSLSGVQDKTLAVIPPERFLSTPAADLPISAPAQDKSATGSSIYFRAHPISDELRRAVHLLDQARAIVADATLLLVDGKFIESDELLLDFKECLPELFCLRTISESFGIIVNAVHNALEARKGVPLTLLHLRALDDLIASVLREPAMSFDRAVQKVMEFEDAGFVVESPVLTGFLDLVEAFESELKTLDAQG